MDTTTDRLVEFAMHAEYSALDARTIHACKLRLIDTFAGAIGAYDESLRKGLGIGAGTQRRHQTGYVETIDQIRSGAIGEIKAARCYWNGQGIWGEPTSQSTWIKFIAPEK